MTTQPANAVGVKHTPAQAASDLKRYARAMRVGQSMLAATIERDWGLYGYTPQIVGEVLSAVATGLPLEAAIDEATS